VRNPAAPQIRTAVPSDVGIIHQLIVELARHEQSEHEVVVTEEQLRSQLFGDDPPARVLVAEVDGGVGGFALYFRTFSTWLGESGIWLEDLYVRPEHRGRGLGGALLGSLREQTDGRVEWRVMDWLTSSIEFYDSLGAEPVPGWLTYRWLP
jgi:GNAT superfamily N-acetyltransferase